MYVAVVVASDFHMDAESLGCMGGMLSSGIFAIDAVECTWVRAIATCKHVCRPAWPGAVAASLMYSSIV